MTLLFTSTALSPAIFSWEGRHGTLERLVSCPITVEAIVLGDMIASILFGLGITVITVFITLGLGLSLVHGITLIVSILLAAWCFSAIGMFIAAPPTDEPSTPMTLSLLIKFPLIFISGIFVPLDQLPSWGIALSACSPLTYFTDLVRYCFTETHYFPVCDRFRRTNGVHGGVYYRHDAPAQKDPATEDVNTQTGENFKAKNINPNYSYI